MNTEVKKSFVDCIKNDRMLEAKKIFETAIMEKVNAKVSIMRQEVAKQFFNKTNNG